MNIFKIITWETFMTAKFYIMQKKLQGRFNLSLSSAQINDLVIVKK